MTLTKFELKKIMPYALNVNIDKYFQPLLITMQRYDINTPIRVAAFLSQVSVESGDLKYVLELSSGKQYEGRKDLGNTEPNDGEHYKGRGLIQITGRLNYQELSNDLKYDFIAHPEMLQSPMYAALAAGWYWNKHNLNSIADTNDIVKVSHVVNGGNNGLQERERIFNLAKQILQAA